MNDTRLERVAILLTEASDILGEIAGEVDTRPYRPMYRLTRAAQLITEALQDIRIATRTGVPAK
jgi:hypothetical protein